jgi:hypothetical protein
MPASSRRLAELTFSLLLSVTALAISALAAAADKPPVRAITAFIDLDPARYEEQFEDTANRLRQASAVFQKAGYEVQTYAHYDATVSTVRSWNEQGAGAETVVRSRSART